jgi:hypothetical protein
VTDIDPQSASPSGPGARHRVPDRRKHPRIETTALPAERGAAHAEPHQPLARRLLHFVGRRRARRDAPPVHGAGRAAARRARSPGIADRLEVILRELDELEAWREASDVCSAIERLRSPPGE